MSNTLPRPWGNPTAASLFALSQGQKNSGPDECHWCGSPCERTTPHDDPPPPPFTRSTSTARRPGNAYVCVGCQLYRRPRFTAFSMTAKLRDRSTGPILSWFVTEQGAWFVDLRDKEDRELLYEHLLLPPLHFSLSLLHERTENHLHLASVNHKPEIKADTVLSYTLDGTTRTYTVHELETALQHGVEGREPGVRGLVELLGPYTPEELRENPPKVFNPNERRPRGRPPKSSLEKLENRATRTVRPADEAVARKAA